MQRTEPNTILRAAAAPAVTAREAAIVKRIVAALRTIPGVVVRKRHGSSFAVAGDPDLYGCYQGRHFEIEVKTPGGDVSKVQQIRIAEWRAAGSLAGVARNVADAMEILRG